MTFGPTVYPVLLPPKIEVMARAYLTEPMSPTLVTTRMPSPTNETDTINGLLRLEAGGGYKPNLFHYDMQCILHGYSPNEDTANDIADQAVALMGAAQGQTVAGFYVVGVENVVTAMRLSDPDVILPRYRAMVTWRVAGQPWNP